jgi:hypothetical protein
MGRVVVVGLMLSAAGCGAAAQEEEAAASSTDRETLTLEDGWVKAAPKGMTAAFGHLHNGTDEDIHLIGVEAEAASMGELHVTVDDGSGTMVMQEAPKGFVIPAGDDFELTPGGNHLMLMGLDSPLESGTTTTVDVIADDGSTWDFDLPVREFTGAQESYQSGGDTDEETSTEGDGQGPDSAP